MILAKKSYMFSSVFHTFSERFEKYHVSFRLWAQSRIGTARMVPEFDFWQDVLPPKLGNSSYANVGGFSPPICKNMRLSQIGWKNFPMGSDRGENLKKHNLSCHHLVRWMACSTIFNTSVSFSTHLTCFFWVPRVAREIQWHTWQDVSWWSHGSFLAD